MDKIPIGAELVENTWTDLRVIKIFNAYMGRSHKTPSDGQASNGTCEDETLNPHNQAGGLPAACSQSHSSSPERAASPSLAERGDPGAITCPDRTIKPGECSEKRDRAEGSHGKASARNVSGFKGPERIKRVHKDPFKKLRGLADSPDHIELYKTFTAPGPGVSKIGFFQGQAVDLAQRFESKTFTCQDLHKCTSAMDCSGPLVFVGLKENTEPFDLFKFTDGESTLAVFDYDLNRIDSISFELGTVVQMKATCHADVHRCIVLFHSGALALFEYSSQQTTHDKGDAQPSSKEERVLINNKRIKSFKFVENEANIIRFHSHERVIVYTDGFTITRVDNGRKTTSKRFKALIIDLVVFRNDGVESIYFLDRNGKHIVCKSDFTEFKEIGVFIGFSRLFLLEKQGLLISTDGLVYKRFFVSPFTDKLHKKACRYYLHTCDGAVTVHRLLNRQNVSRKLFQVVPRGEGVVFCTDKAEFDLFKDTRCHITALSVFDDHFFLATEAGLLIKVFFN